MLGNQETGRPNMENQISVAELQYQAYIDNIQQTADLFGVNTETLAYLIPKEVTCLTEQFDRLSMINFSAQVIARSDPENSPIYWQNSELMQTRRKQYEQFMNIFPEVENSNYRSNILSFAENIRYSEPLQLNSILKFYQIDPEKIKGYNPETDWAKIILYHNLVYSLTPKQQELVQREQKIKRELKDNTLSQEYLRITSAIIAAILQGLSGQELENMVFEIKH